MLRIHQYKLIKPKRGDQAIEVKHVIKNFKQKDEVNVYKYEISNL